MDGGINITVKTKNKSESQGHMIRESLVSQMKTKSISWGN